MIGNDVVDLQLALTESNWRRRGFLDKIFTNSEIEIILSSEKPDLTVWLLWSIKESAYKIVNRESRIRSYNPTSFQILDLEFRDSSARATVAYKQQNFYAESRFSSAEIHTIASENEHLLKRISSVKNGTLIFKKDGIPFLDSTCTIPISISHHGKFTQIIALS